MRSSIHDVLPPKLRRTLRKLGQDISIARRKRNLTVQMMVERLGVAKSTYLRVEKGDPTVATGILAMTLFVLGVDDGLTNLVDPGRDEQGLLLDAQRLPKRVRLKKERMDP
ncbi:MAG: helix-turn-helix transcriptional regulator [Deltaproteobacteria bacterium]|nr:helix-turn-helix transcriptional regulator [Deltaproteobacteria bacterium]